MNKAELIDVISESAETSKAAAGRALDNMFDAISSALAKGDKVVLPGFGSFEVSAHAARAGRNPRTGETIQIAARKAPRFKPAKALKDAVQG